MALDPQTAGCDEDLISWAEPITASPRSASLLEKTKEKQAGPVYGGRKPHLWSCSHEITEITHLRYLNRGKRQMNDE
jgi:hypothetical protein